MCRQPCSESQRTRWNKPPASGAAAEKRRECLRILRDDKASRAGLEVSHVNDSHAPSKWSAECSARPRLDVELKLDRVTSIGNVTGKVALCRMKIFGVDPRTCSQLNRTQLLHTRREKLIGDRMLPSNLLRFCTLNLRHEVLTIEPQVAERAHFLHLNISNLPRPPGGIVFVAITQESFLGSGENVNYEVDELSIIPGGDNAQRRELSDAVFDITALIPTPTKSLIQGTHKIAHVQPRTIWIS